MDITAIIFQFTQDHPNIASILMLMGLARSVAKPLVDWIRAMVKATSTTYDDELLEKAEHSWWWRAAAWLLNYFASIKVGPQR